MPPAYDDLYSFLCFCPFSGVRGMTSCSSLASCWMLMEYNSLYLVRKTLILVFSMGYMNLLGGGGGYIDW